MLPITKPTMLLINLPTTLLTTLLTTYRLHYRLHSWPHTNNVIVYVTDHIHQNYCMLPTSLLTTLLTIVLILCSGCPLGNLWLWKIAAWWNIQWITKQQEALKCGATKVWSVIVQKQLNTTVLNYVTSVLKAPTSVKMFWNMVYTSQAWKWTVCINNKMVGMGVRCIKLEMYVHILLISPDLMQCHYGWARNMGG